MGLLWRWGFLLGALLLAACAAGEPAAVEEAAELEVAKPAATETAVSSPSLATHLPDLGPAPEITNEVWINTDTPVTLASQRGKVVLIEFWTFG